MCIAGGELKQELHQIVTGLYFNRLQATYLS